MAGSNEWYTIKNAAEIDSPCLLVYPERVKANIQTAVDMIGDTLRLRPHVKTSKCRETVMLMLDAGIRKFKCATIAEAEMLGICQAPDVLLAYQPTGPKLGRFAKLIRNYPATQYSCLTDNTRAAADMSAFFHAKGLQVPVYIDLNVGMNRTGIEPGPEALALYLFCNQQAGIHAIGLHAYDGHIRDKEFAIKEQHCDEAYTTANHLRQQIAAETGSMPILIMGGSPSFSVHCKRTDIECSPGTFVYWDKGYLDLCPEQNFQPAALVLSRVISLPSPTKICTDLGHKSIAAENEITRRVYFVNAPQLQAVSQSEEHLVMEAGPGHTFAPGDILYGLPLHVCPTIALYERALVVENGRVTGEWRTVARDRRIEV